MILSACLKRLSLSALYLRSASDLSMRSIEGIITINLGKQAICASLAAMLLASRATCGLVRSVSACAKVLVLVSVVGPLPAAIAGSGQGESGRLQQFEQVMFGKSNESSSADERLNVIETSLFGKARPGTFSDRLDGVGKVLGAAAAPPSNPPAVNEPGSARADLSAQKAGQQINELLKQGLKDYSDGHYAEAAKTFNKVLEIDSRNSNAMYNLAAIDEKRGDLASALRKYELALSFSPNDAELKNTVNSVRRELSSSRAYRDRNLANEAGPPPDPARTPDQQSRILAEQQYQAAWQQAKANRRGHSPVLQGSASSSAYRPPVANVPINSQAPPPVLGVEPRSRAMGNAARNAAAVGLMVGLGVMSSRVGGLGGLRCPICRVLRSR
jgi:hypothetical protein